MAVPCRTTPIGRSPRTSPNRSPCTTPAGARRARSTQPSSTRPGMPTYRKPSASKKNAATACSVELTEGGQAMRQFPVHPGMVLVEDIFQRTSKLTPVAEIPESRRFVYLKDGVATNDPSEATERVPIVEVHVISVN